jgi:DNA-binding IclR family transcriptional regulator
MKPTRTVKAADTLLSVIAGLQELDGAGVTELAEHLGLAKSTVHDHLSTLREHGYVSKDGNMHHLSLRFLDHGSHARDRLDLESAVRPAIDNLAADTGETVWFTIAEQGELVYLYRARGDRSIDFVCRTGRRLPIHVTAAGKAILATYSDQEIRSIADDRKLITRTDQTVTDVETLLEQVRAIESDAVALTRGEDYPGVASLAASVTSPDATVGGVSVSGPNKRFREADLDEIRSELLATVDEIELRLSLDHC